MTKRIAVLLVTAAVACTAPEDSPTDPPSAVRTVDGPVEYSAETLIMESFPVQLQAILTARNTTGDAVVLNFPYPCVAHLQVHRDSALSGEPVWTQERFMGCIAAIFDDTIAAGDTAQYWAPHTDAAEILGDSLPDGRYWLSITLSPRGQRLVVPAGSADLGVPRD